MTIELSLVVKNNVNLGKYLVDVNDQGIGSRRIAAGYMSKHVTRPE